MRWKNGCNAMLKWEKFRKSRKSMKVAYGPHTDIWKINESCTRSYKVYINNKNLKTKGDISRFNNSLKSLQ